ncbi:response regulator [Pedobacter nyackensis]|uniref:histidine kinase n=1 Tax=Pedobacter nyackensis TaxID=475255 RepID=A0A1W2E1Z2_9SPHI|nr:response regulator [Pedobacter nyackensis]SMD03068.1 His Kinase A (phospho-acceptor) domain-containing protein [Pedobacter nyackensis]
MKIVPSNTDLQQVSELESLIEALDDIILELTEKSVIKRVWVKDTTKLFMPPESFIDKSLTEVFGEFGDKFIVCIKKLLDTGERQECIYPDFDPNKHQWYCAKFQKIESDQAGVRIICIIEDITYKKDISDQLQQSTLELKRINNLLEIGLDISKMGGWEYNALNHELFLTKQIYDINECDPGITIDRYNVLDSFDNINKLKLLRILKRTFEQNIPFDIELQLTSLKRSKKWVRLAGVPVIEGQKTHSIQGILKDITQHKNNELELIEAKNLAEQIARKRTETLSIMSHEIRTPLNAIIGISNLLSQTVFPEKEIMQYVEHLGFSSNHLLHLINDILDLEKIESRKMELDEVETDLVLLVSNVNKQFLPLAESKKLELNFYHDDQIPKLMMVDDLRLRRVFNNLIGNAIKFTEKGMVSITLKTVDLQLDRASILFRIADTGIGIPKHFQNLVFDKFHQVHRASHRAQQGSGLGLNITQGLIRLFKSEIKLISNPGEGSVFEFQIDFKLCKPSISIRRSILPEANLPHLPEFKLLIVDDNPTNLLVASGQLKRFGIMAKQADGGDAALEFLKADKFDVILIDLHMPVMDGYQLSRYVQMHYPQTIIVIFTADVLEEVRMRLKEMGIKHILSKPFNPGEMHELFLEVIKA